MITQFRLKELLEYSGHDGLFRWRVRRSGYAKPGTLAGRLDGKGYRQISVDGHRYAAHRLAWLYVNGCFPESEIDHVNGSRDDNRIENLRSVDRTTNMRNKRRYHTAVTPHPGIQNRYGSWQSYIGNQYIGSFDTLEMAIAERRAEEARLGYHANHGRV